MCAMRVNLFLSTTASVVMSLLLLRVTLRVSIMAATVYREKRAVKSACAADFLQ